MGYLPIILAILGFVFLWGIVNYNAMKTRKAEASQAADLVYRYAALRQNIIIQLANIQSGDTSLFTLMQRIKESVRPISRENNSPIDVLSSEQKLSRHIDGLPDQLATEKSYRNSVQQLQKADMEYRIAANRFALKVRQYNELVTKSPSRLVAGLVGFKKMPSETEEES
ncbi:MAG: hypothetical protein RIG62_16055 [Cyclobacteriaceae bacterium]